MPNYRRMRTAGGTWFFTVVTANRRRILASQRAIAVLRESVAEVRSSLPFTVDAWVVMPDHLHAIWSLPEGDADFSKRWGRIKSAFTKRCGARHVSEARRYAGIWQPRFWEHLVRDENDFAMHMDYLHYNPVKHGLVDRVSEWPWSSFHRCVQRGIYAADWGQSEPPLPAVDAGE